MSRINRLFNLIPKPNGVFKSIPKPNRVFKALPKPNMFFRSTSSFLFAKEKKEKSKLVSPIIMGNQKEMAELHEKKVEWAKTHSQNPDNTLICEHCNTFIPFYDWGTCIYFHKYNDLFHPAGGNLHFHYTKMCIGEGGNESNKDDLECIHFAKKYFVNGHCVCGKINLNWYYGFNELWAFSMLNPLIGMEETLRKALVEHVRGDPVCMNITKGVQYIIHCIETNDGHCKRCGEYLYWTTFNWEEFKKRCSTDETYLRYVYRHMTATCA